MNVQRHLLLLVTLAAAVTPAAGQQGATAPANVPYGQSPDSRGLGWGTVSPDGIELTILTGMDSTTRHWRFLRNQEFDMAETSASSYIVARDQGLPFTALPVFLHRRFRHGFIFINTSKGIRAPADLAGRKIGLKRK